MDPGSPLRDAQDDARVGHASLTTSPPAIASPASRCASHAWCRPGRDGHADAPERAAMRLEQRRQPRLALQRHDIGDEPPARLQSAQSRLEHAGIADAAADEDGVGRRLPGEAGRRGACDDLDRQRAERQPVARRSAPPARRAPRRRWRGCADGAGTIPARSSPSRRRYPRAARPARGASAESVIARISALVIWPSWANQLFVEPGCKRQHRAPRAEAATRHRDQVERHDIGRAQRHRRAACVMCSRGAAERFQHRRSRRLPSRARS